MKTSQNLNKVLSKLPKTELKSEKVELSLIEDIEESIFKGLSLKDNADKAIDKAKIEILKASDIARFRIGVRPKFPSKAIQPLAILSTQHAIHTSVQTPHQH